MKKRKIGYTYGSVSGYFAFRKQKSIAFESTLERDLLTLLEFNDSVCDVIEQPITIEYINANGRNTTYTPDFLVYFNETETILLDVVRKPLLIEVKPRRIIQKKFKDLRPKFKIATKYASQNDMIFKIYDEEKIRGAYFQNITFLKRYKNLEYDLDEEQRILTYVDMLGSTTIDHILESLFITKIQKGLALGQIWHLLANKSLLCLYGEPLNYQTTVWLNDNYDEEKLNG
ncbi:MAG: TnsA endonuclease N-terminal domain-containing protein [Sulfurimonas sp.]|uniref:TnsA endonuclease N-terminal domain-containing protein n=1 Tax=Sulfurimonas sp. TaxID=2022749 RepID=UPI0025CE41BE|nr:TnsA endonuclease N-terminal domain-containing protein [Sulfurimonas sp.]MCK9490709.1 TnsA endonuclease N-terminal domain-containing protein [Sulfurimonas sp.]